MAMKSLRMIHPVQRTVQAIRFLCLRSSFCTPTVYNKALHKLQLSALYKYIKPQHLFRLPLRFCTISHNTNPAKKLFHIGTAFRYLVQFFRLSDSNHVSIYSVFPLFSELFKAPIGVKLGSKNYGSNPQCPRDVEKPPKSDDLGGSLVAEAGLEPTTSGL